MSDADFERIKRLQQERNAQKGLKSFDTAAKATNSAKASLTENFDTAVYGRDGDDKFAGYNKSIAVNGGPDDDDDHEMGDFDDTRRLVGQYTASRAQIDEFANTGRDDDMITSREKQAQIASRESDYQKRRFDRGPLTPTRADPFAENVQNGTRYRDTMASRELEREEARVQKLIADKQTNGELTHKEHKPTLKEDTSDKENAQAGSTVDAASGAGRKRKQRWDIPAADSTPTEDTTKKRSRWDVTAAPDEEAAPSRRSRWDMAPAVGGETPRVAQGLATPAHPSQAGVVSFGTDVSARNAPLSDEDLDFLLPGEKEGYKILEPPPGYEPLRVSVRRTVPTPSAAAGASGYGGFMMQEPETIQALGKQLPTNIPGVGELPFFKPEDMTYFGKLFDGADENDLSVEELKERKIARLLLKVKNGTPSQRKSSLRSLTDSAKAFGAGPLFNQILPLLMEKSLEDQERHLLVKVIDRILWKLSEDVRPYVHRILVVIEPLLIDQDYYARVEGREIISNLAKAAGLATMISTMRPEIDHADEYVRNTTARAFAVVASALGISSLLPFLRAVCRSKKSWHARHTGVKIVQQIAILVGAACLPNLPALIDCIAANLSDEQAKVRTVTSLAIAALAEACSPYGIESFDPILNPLWTGARKQRGKGLAGYLKAIGYIIPLMDEEYANYYTSQIMEIVIREYASADEEMKRICCQVTISINRANGITPMYLREHVVDEFFKAFWVKRTALDRRILRSVVDTTIDLAQKVGGAEIVERLWPHLKEENEPYRKMTVETIEKIIASLGTADFGERLEEHLIDGMLFAFQEQTVEDPVLLNGFGTLVNALGERMKPYFPQVVSTMLFRLGHRTPVCRQQSADLISRTVKTLARCGEDDLVIKLGQVLYEYLGEEYPEVLGSILGALRSIVACVRIDQMQPPIKDLLLRVAPILRNRHEKVQENAIDLVGRIAEFAPTAVGSKEMVRIGWEMTEMLKAHKKGIRRAANNTFGYIAKAIGPSDVLAVLLSQLRVSERQSRVCAAVAIAIVAEACGPFSTLPVLMNEYRTPELNVRTGTLKALSFLTEYIGELSKDYVYALIPLLEDALTDRDQVHRQSSANIISHLGTTLAGLGCEDAMVHLLSLLWPNIFETSPHVIDRVIDAINGIRQSVGTGIIMNYTLAGLFSPARKVRQPYHRIYNLMYVQSADSMIPYYPELGEEFYARPELDVVI
ncbi:U2 snRNP component HSH155 [Patellaria atrata CBS 101060]|uniref:U2 snRNP component HSH155 n=1 Tax=Patellaria atrata CBS 101060 TaxID=1346257 RepID=A0A9P4S587_9PEZI|nr:U2 snRNP component HSH155 [Patellaria atrata CBS 101060]